MELCHETGNAGLQWYLVFLDHELAVRIVDHTLAQPSLQNPARCDSLSGKVLPPLSVAQALTLTVAQK